MPDTDLLLDNLKRLRATLGNDGTSAVYAYDAVGNLISIERRTSQVVSIIECSPRRARVGSLISLLGSGFSSDPSENTVEFNGVPALVVSAAPTRILTVVPIAAAAGPISVATASGSATSDFPFTVTDESSPVITAFSPSVATPGNTLTLTGTGFDPALVNNTIILNRTFSHILSASDITLTAEVPAGAGSGRITLISPFGKAISGKDFFIPPAPRTPDDVGFTGRIALGESSDVTIDTPGKIALVVFDGIRGQRVSVGLSEIEFDSGDSLLELSILDPHGSELARDSKFGGDIDTGSLPESGTYTVLVDPGATTVRLVLTASEPVTGTLAIGGPSMPVSLDRPGQDARFTFDVTAGQRVDLGVSDVSFPGAGGGVEVALLHPDGRTLASKIVSSSGGGLRTEPLSDAGAYSVRVDPTDARTSDLTLTLSEPLTGTLIAAASLPISLRLGQTARLTFEGTIGQEVILSVGQVSFGTGSHAGISIIKPDGTTFVEASVGTSGGTIDIEPLPDIGTYTIVVDPEKFSFIGGVTTANMTLTLS